MTKKESVWLIIKLVGVYFGYLTIISLFSIIALLPALLFAPPELKTGQRSNAEMPVTGVQPTPFNGSEGFPNETVQSKNNPKNTDDTTASESVENFLWFILLTTIYGTVGFYLLYDGRLFYALLMREEFIKTKQTEPEVTTLNL